MILTEDVQTISVTETRFFITWAPRPGSDVSKSVTVSRAGDYAGDYTSIGTVSLGTRYIIDETHDAQKWEYPYYKLECDGATAGPFSYEDVRIPEARQVSASVKAFLQRSGYPVLLYPHRSSTTRCPECWDPIMGAPRTRQCPHCFGSGVEKGYDGPILTIAQVLQIPKFRRVDLAAGTDEPVTVDIRFWGFPGLRLNDVIRDLVGRGLYRVNVINIIGPHQCLVEQMARCERLKDTEVTRLLPLPRYCVSVIPPILPYHKELIQGLVDAGNAPVG